MKRVNKFNLFQFVMSNLWYNLQVIEGDQYVVRSRSRTLLQVTPWKNERYGPLIRRLIFFSPQGQFNQDVKINNIHEQSSNW